MDNAKNLIEQIKEAMIKENAFTVHTGAIPGAEYGTDRYSEAVKRICEADPAFIETTSDIAKRFYAGDIGDALDTEDREFLESYRKAQGFYRNGFYSTKYGTVAIENNGLYTVMYFQFER